jgi:hypothetical protein
VLDTCSERLYGYVALQSLSKCVHSDSQSIGAGCCIGVADTVSALVSLFGLAELHLQLRAHYVPGWAMLWHGYPPLHAILHIKLLSY